MLFSNATIPNLIDSQHTSILKTITKHSVTVILNEYLILILVNFELNPLYMNS